MLRADNFQLFISLGVNATGYIKFEHIWLDFCKSYAFGRHLHGNEFQSFTS